MAAKVATSSGTRTEGAHEADISSLLNGVDDPELFAQAAQQSKKPATASGAQGAYPCAPCGPVDGVGGVGGVGGVKRSAQTGIGAPGEGAEISKETLGKFDEGTREAVQGALDAAKSPAAKANIASIVNSEGFSQLSADHRKAALGALTKNPEDSKLASDVASLVSNANFQNLNDATKSDLLGRIPGLDPAQRADVTKVATNPGFSKLDPKHQLQALDGLTKQPHDDRYVSDLNQLLGSEEFLKHTDSAKEAVLGTFAKNAQNLNGRAAAALQSGSPGFDQLSAADQKKASDGAAAGVEATKPGEKTTYAHQDGYREGVSTTDDLLKQGKNGNLPEKAYAGLGEKKEQITKALEAKGATKEEIATILAVAMQETTHMDSSQRDTGKSGASTNVSALNLNADMCKRLGIDNPESLNDPSKLGEAAQVLLKGFREWGVKPTLAFERGGSTAFQDGKSYGAEDYQQGIADIAKQLVEGNHLTDDIRVERNTEHK